MKLHNVRYGFAANSSSTHYFIFVRDKDERNNIYDNMPEDYFGWQNFTASSKELKREYIASIALSHLIPVVGECVSKDLLKAWLKIDIDRISYREIDHQSVPCLPMQWDNKCLDPVFFKEYRDFVMDKSLVILGGNDNNNYPHVLTSAYEPFTLPLLYDQNAELVARKDTKYNFWTLFDRKTGHKIRLTLTEEQPIITRSSYPELVDLKITDHCDAKCSFCYQGSTVAGEHGERHYINHILNFLGENHVFEVAIGGGEPTSHPDFHNILHTARWANVVPNFTTKSLMWLENDSERDFILEHIGNFAFSALHSRDVRKLGALVERYKIENKVQIQVIDDVVNPWEFESMLNECYYYGFPIVILGFKPNGRGADYKQKYISASRSDGWWIDTIKKFQSKGNYCRVGIDTILAKKFEQRLVKEGVSPILFSTDEGAYSCYVDCVQKRMGISSYTQQPMVDLPFSDDAPDIFTKTFRKFKLGS